MGSAHIVATVGLLSLFSLSSCTTLSTTTSPEPNRKAEEESVAPVIEGWRLVRIDPPTYFPEGIPTNVETDFKHGEWVDGGVQGAKWYIPHEGARGLSSRELAEEAFAMRSGTSKSEQAIRKVADVSVKTGLSAVALTAGAGGADVGDAFDKIWSR